MAKKKKNNELKNHFPEDIIVHILSRLPVKYLLRFKSVSKRWRFIISDPHFAKSHFKLASEQQTLCPRLLVSIGSQFQTLDLETPSIGDNFSVRNLAFPFKEAGQDVVMLGSCNGMVCVAILSRGNVYICNPSNGFYQKLPDPGFVSKRAAHLSHYGFGYVSAADDYKVVVTDCTCVIFSLIANSWKRVEAPKLSSKCWVRGALSNEALHWLHSSYDQPPVHAIVAFDLAKEEFREMPLPTLNNNSLTLIDVEVLLGGCLSLMCSTASVDPKCIEIWVMREYGVGESWTKLFNCRIDNESVRDLQFHLIAAFSPIYFTESGTIVVICLSTCFSSELDFNTYQHHMIRLDNKEDGLHKVLVCSGRYRIEGILYGMMVYDESLLSFKGHHGVENQETQSPPLA